MGFESLDKKHDAAVGPDLQRALAVREFAEAFADRDAAVKIRALADQGKLDLVVPGFAEKRALLQDERWHGNTSVADHMIESLQYAEESIARRTFSNPEVPRLIRIAAFFQDVGKLPPSSSRGDTAVEKDVAFRGAQEILEVPGDLFRRVRFLGHPGVGAMIVQKLYEEGKVAGEDLPAELALNERQLQVVSHLVRTHMRALEGVRATKDHAVEEVARVISSEIYPVSVQNSGLPPADILQAYLVMQEVEILSAQPARHFSADDTRLPEFQRDWSQQMGRWNELISELNRSLPLIERAAKDRLLLPLLNWKDLEDLGCPAKLRLGILDEVRANQLDGELVSRVGAVASAWEIAARSGVLLDHNGMEKVLGRAGYRDLCTRQEHIQSTFHEDRLAYVVKRYTATPVQQLTPAMTDSELRQQLDSGNFPYLASYSHWRYPDRDGDFKNLLVSKFANLMQAEAFLATLGVEGEVLENIDRTFSPTTRTIEVDRRMDRRQVCIKNGFQGIESHTGHGGVHFLDQRREKLDQFFRKAGEKPDMMEARFLEEGVIHAAGTGTLRLTSHLLPERFELLAGPVKNSSTQAVVLVIDKGVRSDTVVTAFFCEKPAEVRRTFKAALGDLSAVLSKYVVEGKDFQGAAMTEQRREMMIQKSLAEINQFISQFGCAKLTEADVTARATSKTKLGPTRLQGKDLIDAGIARTSLPAMVGDLKDVLASPMDFEMKARAIELVRAMVRGSQDLKEIAAALRQLVTDGVTH